MNFGEPVIAQNAVLTLKYYLEFFSLGEAEKSDPSPASAYSEEMIV